MPEIESADESLKTLSGLHLWHAPMSSCSQRVRIVLAETGQDYVSHLVNLEKDEHASVDYQKIHPDGLVPALVDNGRLIIESIDIIRHLASDDIMPEDAEAQDLLDMADKAQQDLKLLTFEFLFRAKPPAPEEAAEAFQKKHQNAWLRQFRRDFASGFNAGRINDAIKRTDQGFRTLDTRLSDGRLFLNGGSFGLCDVAWMPNVHRFSLMGWPFEHTPHLAAWFELVSDRPSYRDALLDWQGEHVARSFADYTVKRRAEGTDVRSYPHFAKAGDNGPA